MVLELQALLPDGFGVALCILSRLSGLGKFCLGLGELILGRPKLRQAVDHLLPKVTARMTSKLEVPFGFHLGIFSILFGSLELLLEDFDPAYGVLERINLVVISVCRFALEHATQHVDFLCFALTTFTLALCPDLFGCRVIGIANLVREELLCRERSLFLGLLLGSFLELLFRDIGWWHVADVERKGL